MGECQVLGHRHGDQMPTGISGRLLNSGNDFLGLANTHTHFPLLVSNHNNSTERHLLASLHHLGHTANLHHSLLEIVLRGSIPAAPSTLPVVSTPSSPAAWLLVLFVIVVPPRLQPLECLPVQGLIGSCDVLLALLLVLVREHCHGGSHSAAPHMLHGNAVGFVRQFGAPECAVEGERR